MPGSPRLDGMASCAGLLPARRCCGVKPLNAARGRWHPLRAQLSCRFHRRRVLPKDGALTAGRRMGMGRALRRAQGSAAAARRRWRRRCARHGDNTWGTSAAAPWRSGHLLAHAHADTEAWDQRRVLSLNREDALD
eukprot:366539-Chlamydomonas_euryale.AAC.19